MYLIYAITINFYRDCLCVKFLGYKQMNSQTVSVKPMNNSSKPMNTNVKPMNTNTKPAVPATNWFSSLFGSSKPKPMNTTTVGGRRKMTVRKNRSKTRKNKNRKNKKTRKH